MSSAIIFVPMLLIAILCLFLFQAIWTVLPAKYHGLMYGFLVVSAILLILYGLSSGFVVREIFKSEGINLKGGFNSECEYVSDSFAATYAFYSIISFFVAIPWTLAGLIFFYWSKKYSQK